MKGKMGEGVWDSSFFLLLGNRTFGVLPILYFAEFKGKKMDKFIPDRKI